MCHLSTYQVRTWYGNEGIKNTKQGDRKVLFLFLASITPQTQAHEPTLTIILRYMHWILQHVGSRKHRHRSTKITWKSAFLFFILSSQPLILPLSNHDASLKTPKRQHCLGKGHDLGGEGWSVLGVERSFLCSPPCDTSNWDSHDEPVKILRI